MVYVLLFFAAMTAIGLLMKLFSQDNSTKSRVPKSKSSQKEPEQKQPAKEQISKPKKEEPIVQPSPSPLKSESKPQATKSENKTNSFVTLPSSKNLSNLSLSDAEFQQELVEVMDTNGKLEAVKFAMEVKGWGLKQAKTYCDQLFATPPTKKVKNTSPDLDLLSETKEKMRVAGKLEAVKFLMAKTSLSLQEAKKHCDQLEEESRGSANSSKPIPTPKPKNETSADAKLEAIALEEEIKKLMANTSWDYATAKAYCEQALEYKKKIGAPARLKKK
jgi:ribosomal protein L7/L12